MVSVIIPFFNKADFFREAVDSVLNQTFPDYELLLCDDGSTDGSTEIAREYAGAYPGKVRYFQHAGHANLGQFSTRIAASRHARASVIAPLDHDDAWDSLYLEKHYEIWKNVESRGVYLSYGPAVYWFQEIPGGGKDYIQPMPSGAPAIFRPGDLLETFFANDYAATPLPSCAFIRKEVFEGLPRFEARARDSLAFEDQYLSWYAASRWPVHVHCNAWVRYRQHGGSYLASSSQGMRARQAELIFLGTIAAYLSDQCPEHSLLGGGALSARIRALETSLGFPARLRESLQDRMPRGAYTILRSAYRVARDLLSLREK